tara:strand:+ start:3417 stop:3530 length:114 start_codon:yes stop_codon:yes gene_type:complete
MFWTGFFVGLAVGLIPLAVVTWLFVVPMLRGIGGVFK